MRKVATEFSILHPSRRFRHEKPDLKMLLERKEESYIDVAQASPAFSGSGVMATVSGFPHSYKVYGVSE